MSKRLEIDYIRIKDVQFGEKTSLKDGVLTVNKQELIDIAASELFGSLDIQLAKPGESCRVPLPFSVKIGRIFWVHFTSKLFQIVFFNKRENSI